jgi:hypothetical protein
VPVRAFVVALHDLDVSLLDAVDVALDHHPELVAVLRRIDLLRAIRAGDDRQRLDLGADTAELADCPADHVLRTLVGHAGERPVVEPRPHLAEGFFLVGDLGDQAARHMPGQDRHVGGGKPVDLVIVADIVNRPLGAMHEQRDVVDLHRGDIGRLDGRMRLRSKVRRRQHRALA